MNKKIGEVIWSKIPQNLIVPSEYRTFSFSFNVKFIRFAPSKEITKTTRLIIKREINEIVLFFKIAFPRKKTGEIKAK